MTRIAVEDELAIRELFARYYRALDTGDTEGYLDCYTVDGEATEETSEGGLEVRKGREEIRKLVRKFHDRPDFPGHQHLFSNLIFDRGEKPGTWEVRSYAWSTINRPPEKPYLHWCGHVRDIVEQENGEWKLARKDIMGWAGEVLSRFDAKG